MSIKISHTLMKSIPFFFNNLLTPRFIVLEQSNYYLKDQLEKTNYLIDTTQTDDLPHFSLFLGDTPFEAYYKNKILFRNNPALVLPRKCTEGVCIDGTILNRAKELQRSIIKINPVASIIINSELFLELKKGRKNQEVINEIKKKWTTFINYSLDDYRKRFD